MICQGLTREQSKKLYIEVLEENDTKAMRELCLKDLFFLITVAFKRKDLDKDWLYERIREIEREPNDHLDLWARDHYKSTCITYAKSIQDILNNPEVTIGIFSHTRPIAKGFLDQIKRELESNTFLKSLFPDVLYKNPESEAPKWSLDSGIIVKRSTNPKESTVEAWGLVDGQPTGKHFSLLVYDDVVTRESVTTPEQIAKTNSALELSYNLGSNHGGKRRFIGTRYHANDTYKMIMDRGTVKPRIYPATHDGLETGEPVLLSKEKLAEKRRDMGIYTFNCQMLQNPTADKSMGFKEEWLRFYRTMDSHSNMNKFILVDPASKKKKTNDYTVMAVIGLAPDNNYYLLHAIRDRLNLTQRTEMLFKLHREWQPKKVAYEQYGMQSDIEHIKYIQDQDNYRFEIVEVGGQMAKEDRIRRLVPIFEQHRFYLPEKLYFFDYEGRRVDFIERFLNDEYISFPVSTHDDMLDCISRILEVEIGAQFPKLIKPQLDDEEYSHSGSWLG